MVLTKVPNLWLDIPMNETTAEPEFEGMAWPEIVEILDEYSSEQQADEREREFILRNKWSSNI